MKRHWLRCIRLQMRKLLLFRLKCAYRTQPTGHVIYVFDAQSQLMWHTADPESVVANKIAP